MSASRRTNIFDCLTLGSRQMSPSGDLHHLGDFVRQTIGELEHQARISE